MEIKCEGLHPPVKHAVYHGPLSRFSRASGRFLSFNAFLHREADTSEKGHASVGRLYFIDTSGDPSSCIVIGPGDVVRDSSKAPNAFSITGSTGAKVVVQAPSPLSKAEWVHNIMGLIKGDIPFASATVSVSGSVIDHTEAYPLSTNSLANEIALTSASLKADAPTSREVLPIAEGVLLKKGNLTGQYVRRWFELVQDVGLFYSLYVDSPRDTFQRILLQGLSVAFLEEKCQIVIPASGSRKRVMILKCPQKEDFARWRKAIQMESSKCITTMRHDEYKGSEAAESPIEASTGGVVRSSPICIDVDDNNTLSSSMMAQEPSFASDGSAVAVALFGVGFGIDSRIMELAEKRVGQPNDSQSDTSPGGTSVSEEFLQSIEEVYKPMKNTPGIELELQRYYAGCLPYGLEAALKRLQQRFTLPIRGPYEAVNEHIVLLDLDVGRVRDCLGNTIRLYGDEVAIRNVVREMDYSIRVYIHVREHLLVRLGIAAFREQINRNGLPLGVNGTVDILDTFLVSDSSSTVIYAKVVEMWKGLFQALQNFRSEFDVFDESEETIIVMEDALNKLHDWLQRNVQKVEINREHP